MLDRLRRYQFLFEELVKRDFKKKYKGTILGMGWSMLSPLLILFVLKIVFENFFARGIDHYTTYLFSGNLVYMWFADATGQGMRSLVGNAGIFTKVNVPKYIFLLAGSTQTLLNFLLSFVVFFFFCALDHIAFTWKFTLLLYPIVTLFFFNIGVSLILSALFVFFRDLNYLWGVALELVMYGSAIFYPVSLLPPIMQSVLLCNPVYRHISYVRDIVLAGTIPGWQAHLTLFCLAALAILLGGWMYKHYNTRFLYYV